MVFFPPIETVRGELGQPISDIVFSVELLDVQPKFRHPVFETSAFVLVGKFDQQVAAYVTCLSFLMYVLVALTLRL